MDNDNELANETKIIGIQSKEKIAKIRIDSQKWTFTDTEYCHNNQLLMVLSIQSNNYTYNDATSKIAFQQINKKIYGYKQQDVSKQKYNKDSFLHLHSIIDKMIECELLCYYCHNQMDVLYTISREMTQWTVDRIDNALGHNLDNYYLACLECNLKRRRRSDDKFLFTKQLKIVKLLNND